jgi:hypothetical protein
MNPIVIAAIINAAGLIVVAVINAVISILQTRRSEKEHVLLDGGRTPPGTVRSHGPGRSRAASPNSAGGKLRAVNLAFGVVFLFGLLGAGFVWTHQRFVGDASPRISITTVPLAGSSERDRIEAIGGTVSGAVPADARVVVYANTGGQWYVQPDTRFPFTLIADHAWVTSTRPGAQYAALLVRTGFTAPPVAPALPVDANVLSVAHVIGR